MKIDNEEIKRFITAARRENNVDASMLQKEAFQQLLHALIIKTLKITIDEYERAKIEPDLKAKLQAKDTRTWQQLQALWSMDDFLELQTYKNCVFHFQALTLRAQDQQILKLQREKQEEIQKRIETEEAMDTLKENIDHG